MRVWTVVSVPVARSLARGCVALACWAVTCENLRAICPGEDVWESP